MARVLSTHTGLPEGLPTYNEFTLAGILETIALMIDGPLVALQPWAEAHTTRVSSAFGKAWRMWQRDGSPNLGTDIHGVRTVEYYRLRHRADATSDHYKLYAERFVRSLIKAGFPKRFSYALAGAFGEMTDNVIQHSLGTEDEFSGLAGYHVDQGYTAFSVVDAGQGILACLSSVPQWRHLKTPQEAIRAAVCNHASSRIGQGEGEGFKTLFRRLADRNGIMRFRSGGAVLTIGDGGTHREAAEIAATYGRGFQMSACCGLKEIAQEESIKMF